MTETANGGLPEAADGRVLTASAIISPAQYLADLIDSDADDLTGFAPYAPTTGDHSSSLGERDAEDAAPTSPRSWGFDVDKINQSYALAVWGGKTVVVNEQPTGPVNDRVRVMSFESMSLWFGNKYTEAPGPDGKIRTVNWAKAWHSHPRRRSYAGVEFFPNPDGAKSTPEYLNFWRGFEVTPSASGAYPTFHDHLLNNICDGDIELFKYVFGWMAHIVQKPRERLGTAIVLRGRRGTGKSKMGEVLGSLFPSHYFQVDDARYVTGQFNAYMSGCLLLQADEAVWAGDKAAEGRLKGLITSETQMIESKGVDPIRMKNNVRLIMTSNEGWVVPAGMDERRFVVLDVNPRCAQNRTYFAEMDDELNAGGRERLLYDLQTFDLSQVDLWQLPQTDALLEQKLRSLDPIDDFWFNRLHECDEWHQTVIADDLYNEYVQSSSRIGVGRKRSPADFGKRLAQLVPALKKPRPTIEINGEKKRRWCYLLPSLDDCRAAFDELVGQPVKWPAPPSREGERAQKPGSSDDDDVPV